MSNEIKTAIIADNGFEEIEAIVAIDILRRANIRCDIVSIKDEYIKGSHGIKIKSDMILDDSVKNYDLIILPGGIPGSLHLRDNDKVIEIIKYFNDKNKYIAAICAAPIVLAKANVINNKKITSYPGYENELQDAVYIENEKVVIDGNIITSRGPATAFEFAYKIAEVLGVNVDNLRDGMMYNFLMN